MHSLWAHLLRQRSFYEQVPGWYRPEGCCEAWVMAMLVYKLGVRQAPDRELVPTLPLASAYDATLVARHPWSHTTWWLSDVPRGAANCSISNPYGLFGRERILRAAGDRRRPTPRRCSERLSASVASCQFVFGSSRARAEGLAVASRAGSKQGGLATAPAPLRRTYVSAQVGNRACRERFAGRATFVKSLLGYSFIPPAHGHAPAAPRRDRASTTGHCMWATIPRELCGAVLLTLFCQTKLHNLQGLCPTAAPVRHTGVLGFPRRIAQRRRPIVVCGRLPELCCRARPHLPTT